MTTSTPTLLSLGSSFDELLIDDSPDDSPTVRAMNDPSARSDVHVLVDTMVDVILDRDVPGGAPPVVPSVSAIVPPVMVDIFTPPVEIVPPVVVRAIVPPAFVYTIIQHEDNLLDYLWSDIDYANVSGCVYKGCEQPRPTEFLYHCYVTRARSTRKNMLVCGKCRSWNLSPTNTQVVCKLRRVFRP